MKTQGFTLIETMSAVGILVLVAIGAAAFMIYFYRGAAYGSGESDALESARRGMEIASRNIREASFSDEGAHPLASAGANSMTFYANIDGDMKIERVHIFLDGTDLKRGITESAGDPPAYPAPETDAETSRLSSLVQNGLKVPAVSLFRYFALDGAEITDYARLEDIARADMTLIVNTAAVRYAREFTLRSSAVLRNMR